MSEEEKKPKKQTTCGISGCGEEHKTMADLYKHQNTIHSAICEKYRCGEPHHAHISADSRRRCNSRKAVKIPAVVLQPSMLMAKPKVVTRGTQVAEEAIDEHRPFLNRKP